MEFSDRVGEILITNPTVAGGMPQFKFYIWSTTIAYVTRRLDSEYLLEDGCGIRWPDRRRPPTTIG
jgi:hypothetical protein